MQKDSGQSKTKILVIAVAIILFSLTMLFVSIFQIVKINKLNDKIAQQEREIEELNNLYDDLLEKQS